MTIDRERVFLSAEWRYLAMANYIVDPALLRSHVPRGTELDTHEGQTYCSIVAFRFLRTRVLGIPIPFHRNFDEINLRFYVRREVGGDVRRGVVFLREAVPRYAIAAMAKAWYNEPYVAVPMRSDVPAIGLPNPRRVSYEWEHAGAWNRVAVTTTGDAYSPVEGSQAQFITEHFWGYTRQRDGSTIEYRVTHPSWRVWAAADVDVSGNLGAFYGPAFADTLSIPPVSAFLAEGSPIAVYRPRPL